MPLEPAIGGNPEMLLGAIKLVGAGDDIKEPIEVRPLGKFIVMIYPFQYRICN
jgi:hypothetical protein